MTKKRKVPPTTDGEIIFCWFCEREFADTTILKTHQKAKHFTCHICNDVSNSVAELQNHVNTRHSVALERISNALNHRQNPSTVPAISGMEGIPLSDLQEFKARVKPTMPSTIMSSTSTALKHQSRPTKQEPPTKKAKIDTPLDPGTIQAQLAAFQKRKEEEEIKELLKTGTALPPGLTPSQAISIFIKTAPPGSGPFAAKPLPNQTGISGLALESVNDGKLGSSSAAFKSQPQFQSTSSPASKQLAPAPPPSLKFTESEVILSLSPPTPGPLAPGQERHTVNTSTAVYPQTKANMQTNAPYPGNTVGFPPVGTSNMPVKPGNMGKGFGRGRGRGSAQQLNQGYGRAGNFQGKGMKPSYQPYPQQNVGPPFSQPINLGGGHPGHQHRQMNPRPPFPPPQVANTMPQHLNNYHHPPYQGYTPPPPPPQAQRGPAIPLQMYKGQAQPHPGAHLTPQVYNSVAQLIPTPPVPPVPFEVLYPMHGKKAPAFASPIVHASPPVTPFQAPSQHFNQNFQSQGLPFQSISPPSFQSQAAMVQPPLPVSPPPPLPTVLDVSTAGHSGQRSEIRIITEDVISPEEKLAIKYGYGKS